MKYFSVIALSIFLLADVLIPIIVPNFREYPLSISFLFGFINLLFLLPEKNRYNWSIGLLITIHFLILFGWHYILFQEYLSTLYLNIAAEWYCDVIYNTRIIFPNLVILSVLSIIMILQNRKLDKKGLNIFTPWIILGLSLFFYIYVSYHYYYSFPLSL